MTSQQYAPQMQTPASTGSRYPMYSHPNMANVAFDDLDESIQLISPEASQTLTRGLCGAAFVVGGFAVVAAAQGQYEVSGLCGTMATFAGIFGYAVHENLAAADPEFLPPMPSTEPAAEDKDSALIRFLCR